LTDSLRVITTAEVPIDSVYPNPNNPRKTFDPDGLTQLADSIREVGILQPLVVVMSVDRSPTYRLVAGERRWRAAKMVGLTHVPCMVRQLTPTQEAEIMLIENLQRRDLDPIEEAQAYKSLLAEHGHTQAALAAKLGVSQSQIANRIRLLDLPDKVTESISHGIISPSHGKELLAHKHLPTAILEAAVAHIIEDSVPVKHVSNIVGIAINQLGKSVLPIHVPFDSKKYCIDCTDMVPENSTRYQGLPWRMTCVNLRCYDEKVAAAAAVRQVEVDKLLADAKAGSKTKKMAGKKLGDLPYDSYKKLEETHDTKFDVKECVGCDDRVPALDWNNRTVWACFNPACHRRKNLAVSKSQNKERRHALAEEFEEIVQLAQVKITDAMPSSVYMPQMRKASLVYLAAHLLAEVKGYADTREMTAWKYMERTFGIKDDVFKASEYGMLTHRWATTKSLLEGLSEADLLRIIFEWPAMAQGLSGPPQAYLLKGGENNGANSG
jgi:ParB/RepB/Spo0J family partition protein